MTWTVGKEQFKGWFKGDQRFKGTMTLSDGNIYEGEWKNDAFHGQGKLTFKPIKKGEKGLVFEGLFENGKQEKEGKLIFPNGDIYDGHIE